MHAACAAMGEAPLSAREVGEDGVGAAGAHNAHEIFARRTADAGDAAECREKRFSTPRSHARWRSSAVPMPGRISDVRRAFLMFAAATSIHSQSVLLPGP